MSFDLAFWRDGKALTVEAAARIYDELTDGLVGVVEEAEAIESFYRDVVSVYPDLNDENMYESPWASPLYVTSECVIAAISWSRVDEVVPALLDLAVRHGLTAYDPQDQVIRATSA